MSPSSSNGSSFESDPRRRQELRMRPVANRIYQNLFGESVGIDRAERDTSAILDIEFAIDVKLSLPNGMILTGQEKFLSHRYASFRSVTVEYFQNWRTEEHGDWFRLASQFYFVGYATKNEGTFDPWILLDWPRLVLLTNQKGIKWHDNRNRDGRARASFRYCIMDQIPRECIIAASLTH